MKDLLEAKNFLVLGFINFLITNLILQISLLIFPVWVSTLVSQVINYILGLNLYGKYVFKKKILTKRIALKYLIISAMAWILNTLFINLIVNLNGFSEGLAAFTVIPIIVIYSFLAQKYFAFRN